MSASDAAPLPRLGEVFFDVRGDSRTMRLSWYADTGVAVISIWQGGMCTGTFRLAIADLPRMVETLQRGPGRTSPPADAAQGRGFTVPPADPWMNDGLAQASPTDATAQVPAVPPGRGWYDAEPGGYQSSPADHPGEPARPRNAAGRLRPEPVHPPTVAADHPAGPGDATHAMPAAYPAQPGYAAGPGYPADRGYGPDHSYAPEPGHAADAGYAPERGHAADAGYAPEPGYPADRGYAADPGYAPDAAYTQEPGYAPDAGYTQDPGYAADPGYAPEPGYAAAPGFYPPVAPDYRESMPEAHYPVPAPDMLPADSAGRTATDYPAHYGVPADEDAEGLPPAGAYRRARHGAPTDSAID